jgi:hypothetical protein
VKQVSIDNDGGRNGAMAMAAAAAVVVVVVVVVICCDTNVHGDWFVGRVKLGLVRSVLHVSARDVAPRSEALSRGVVCHVTVNQMNIKMKKT